jgi:uncharacterized protein (DUF486 family)
MHPTSAEHRGCVPIIFHPAESSASAPHPWECNPLRSHPEPLRLMNPYLAPVLLLIASNVFMTFAWYGHLKFKAAPLWIAVLASWSIAFVEYWLAVPANRIGLYVYSAAELKTMQEVITLAVFAVFSVLYLNEPIGMNHATGFALIAVGAFFIFKGAL